MPTEDPMSAALVYNPSVDFSFSFSSYYHPCHLTLLHFLEDERKTTLHDIDEGPARHCQSKRLNLSARSAFRARRWRSFRFRFAVFGPFTVNTKFPCIY